MNMFANIRNKPAIVGALLFICFLAGYFAGSDAAKMRSLESEIKSLREELEANQYSNRKMARTEPPEGNNAMRDSQESSDAPSQPLESARNQWQEDRNMWIRKDIEEAATRRAIEYDQLFTELGIPSEKHGQLLQILGRIYAHSMQTEFATRDLLEAQQKYDKELKSLLSDSDYERYRNYEERKRGAAEVKKVKSFADTAGMALSSADQDQLATLIANAGVYSQPSWHGPFDEVPKPAFGGAMVRDSMKEEIEALQAKLPALWETADAIGLPEEQKRLLTDYFANSIEYKEFVMADAHLLATDPDAWNAKYEPPSRSRSRKE